MGLIEKATKTKFQTDVKREPIRPKEPKHRREPSPHRYSDNVGEIGEEEEGQPQQQSPAAQTGTGLTGPSDRSDRSGQRQPSSRQKPSSPIKKLINLFVGMCKSQRDVEVEQQRKWRASKKERYSIKMMHNAMNLQLPRSPISPSPPEVEIPSVDARMQGYMNARYFEEYGHYFYPDVGATSSTPAPGEGVFGSFPTYGAARPSESAPFPPPPVYGFDTFGAPGTSTMAPLHTS